MKDDFPVFGLPTMPIRTPSLMGFDASAVLSSFEISFIMFLFCSFIFFSTFFGKSSSEKSIKVSKFAKLAVIFLLISVVNSLNPPEMFFIASSLCFSVSALIISEMLSVFTRSILLFNKALFVNSPGSASLAPTPSNVL